MCCSFLPLYTCTIYRVSWYLRLLVLSILTCSLNMSFLARLVSDNSERLEILELGHRPLQPLLRKQFLHGSEFSFVATCASDLTSINFKYIRSFPKLGAITLIRGSSQRVRSDAIGFYEYDFLLVINCTRGRILHRFRDIAIRYVQRRYIWLPLLRFTPDGRVLLGRPS